jgi:23S rRNA pseudouridine1911/1915/1917 synthase
MPPWFGRGIRGGEYAVTRYRLVSQKIGFWVAEVEPETGRTNQIRIHFRQIGCPLLGERKYAYGKDFAVKFPRVALHAERIAFDHPATGKRVSFSAPIPQDMKKVMSNEE